MSRAEEAFCRRTEDASTSTGAPDGGDPVVATLVVAHPDDECMFFAPALSRLGGIGRWTVICLSNGNAFGLGRTREKELVLSCGTFEISSQDVEIVDDPRLQDGMGETWDPRLVARYVESHCRSKGTTHVLGFDAKGISGHPNHCACAQALEMMSRKRNSPYSVWAQVTCPRACQYAGFLSLLWHVLRTSLSVLFGKPESSRITCVTHTMLPAYKGMRMHRSQLVWFRYLHLIFSRYVYINVLQRL